MKKLIKLQSLCFIIIIILFSCEPGEVPTLTTSALTNITGTTATGGGTITKGDLVMIVERGICWSKDNTPTIEDYRTIELGGSVTFISNMSYLDPATTYYVRAYVTNKAGTGYGNELSFITLGQEPTVSTEPATNITATSAKLNGKVNANYISTTVTFEYGTTTNYGQTVTATPNPVTGNSTVTISSTITGLTQNVPYHYRIIAVNSLGTVYGLDQVFIANLGIGSTYGGGIVFYIDNTGQHGLIVAPSDQSSGIQWYNGTYVTTGATGQGSGTGQTNTNAIVAIQGAGAYAARICNDLELNGYNDWFLPSLDEFTPMYLNLYKNGIGGFTYNWTYWTSSEVSNTKSFNFQFGYAGGVAITEEKNKVYRVRAIRAF